MEIIERYTLDNRYIVKIEGSIFNDSAKVFQKKLEKILAEELMNVVLDLTEVNAITSAGLKAIVFLEREITRRGGRLNIISPSPMVAELLHMTRISLIYKNTLKI